MVYEALAYRLQVRSLEQRKCKEYTHAPRLSPPTVLCTVGPVLQSPLLETRTTRRTAGRAKCVSGRLSLLRGKWGRGGVQTSSSRL